MSQLVTINNTFESYQKLISFYQEHKDKLFDTIHLEIRHSDGDKIWQISSLMTDSIKTP